MNPTDELVYEGIKLARAKKIDGLLAVGGGSVIDTAKAIQQSFRQTVGYFHTCGDRKITLHDVYHHIDNAYGGLFG